MARSLPEHNYRAQEPIPYTDPGVGIQAVMRVMTFSVTEDDRVIVDSPEGPKSLGWNHHRAWKAAMDYACTRPDYRTLDSGSTER